MSGGLRRTMAALHTWSGLTVGWVLYAIFITGTLSYFRTEISHWMRPELLDARPSEDWSALAIRLLQERAPDSPRWAITPPQARDPVLRVAWMAVPKRGEPNRLLGRFETLTLDPSTGAALTPRQTHGGDFLQRFHFELGMKPQWGRWLVGFCAMSMLVAILSGIIVHKQIFKNLFTFRPHKGPRSWLDAHNVAGALALPYHVLITYSGLLTLMLIYMPSGVQASYKYDPGAFLMEAFPNPPQASRVGRSAALAPIEPLLQEAARRWGVDAAPASITIDHPNDEGARVQMLRHALGRVSNNAQTITFDGVSGELIAVTPQESATMRAYGALYGLHLAHFAPISLRWAFLLSGLLGAAMVASGLVLWAVKRRPDPDRTDAWPLGHRLVEVLNVGTIVGIPIAVAAYFWANRLLPVALAGRAAWEVRCFFAAWAISHAAALLQAGHKAWRTQLAVCALLFGLLPLVNALTTPASLNVTLLRGPGVYAGFDLAMLSVALLFALVAWHVSRRSPAGWGPATVSSTPKAILQEQD